MQTPLNAKTRDTSSPHEIQKADSHQEANI